MHHASFVQRHRAIVLVATGLVAILAGCSDPPPGTLFDEDGVWSLVEYDIGDGLNDLPQARKDAFLLKLDKKNKVATAASCTSESMNFTTPDNSPCHSSEPETEWQCRCFAYAFQEEVMQWQEFAPGAAMAPKVKFDPDAFNMSGGGGEESGGGTGDGTGSGGGEGGSESGGMSGGDLTVITISELPDRSDTYDFRPLPLGLFGGDFTSHFIFEARASTLIDQVYMDDEGRKAYCEPCLSGMP